MFNDNVFVNLSSENTFVWASCICNAPILVTFCSEFCVQKTTMSNELCFSVYQFFPTITMVILDNYFRTENFLNALDPL